MSKSGTCELCGLPDNSYSVEDNGNVFKVCKLCYDGFIAKNGSDSTTLPDDVDDIEELARELEGVPASVGGARPETLSPEQMAKLLKSDQKRHRQTDSQQKSDEERRKADAAAKRAVAAKVEQTLAADTENITRELLETKEEIMREEERIRAERAEAEHSDDNETRIVSSDRAETDGAKPQTAESEGRAATKANDRADERQKRAAERYAAELARLRRAANPTIDDERIKITSPEVELPKDKRLKTNLDVATEGYVGSERFLRAFKYVIHPVAYAVFAGAIVLAVFTALMITMTWKEAVIDFFAAAGAVAIGALLVWYIKRRLEIDRRTVLLRIRQEQILFDSMRSPCYRELKTKYPMIKAAAWLMGRLSVILPVAVIVCGTAAGVICTFLTAWWLMAPMAAGAAIAGVLVYYAFKLAADKINYKLDMERNQQIIEQSMLDILSRMK